MAIVHKLSYEVTHHGDYQLNRQGHLHIQLVKNEPKAFRGKLAKYGKFSNVTNYLVMASQKAEDLDERIGYYGEHLVLL